MKANIHPQYFSDCQVSCTCGNKFTIGSTVEKIDVEVCSKCHPFFTGQQKFVDVKGRIDRYLEKQAKGKTYTKKAKVTKSNKKDKVLV